jgi:hypothetical protein
MTDTTATSAPAGRARGSLRVFVLSFVAALALGLSWAAASPAFSGPDESAHVLRAYSAGRGQIIGPDGGEIPEIIGETTLVDAPRRLGDLAGSFTCYVFQSKVPAACATDPEVGDGTGEYQNTAGRTPPLYHLLVSPPLELWPRLRGVYAARALGATLFATLVAGAITVSAARGLRNTIAGIFLACTPMAWYFSGVLNPSGLEIASGVAVWSAGVAVLHDLRHDRRPSRGAIALLSAGGMALAATRSLGPLWVAVAGVALLAFAAMAKDLRRVARERRIWLAAALVAGAAVANTAWVVGADALANSSRFADVGLGTALARSVGHQSTMWHSMFAQFGYLDTDPPEGVHVALVACWFVLVAVAISVARRREKAGIVGLLLVALAVGVAIEASQYNRIGPVWQGRYTLPVLGGVPIRAGWLLDRHRMSLPSAPSLRRIVVVVATLAHAAAFWFALRRFAVGTDGKVLFFQRHTWLDEALIPVTIGGLAVIALVGAGTLWAARERPSYGSDRELDLELGGWLTRPDG